MTLMAHRGGWQATPADLASVSVPDDTDTWKAVPYPRLLEEVKLHLPRFGLTIEREQYALARDGNQMFGVIDTKNGHPDSDWGMAIGIRSSYDRSLAVDLVAGARVFVCDNLSFHGESQATRKHTVNIWRDLPSLIYDMLAAVSVLKTKMAADIDQMRDTQLTSEQAHHIMVMAVRANAIPASKLPRVIAGYDDLDNPEFGQHSAWALFNAFTAFAGTQQPWQQMDNTLRLTEVFRAALN